MAQFIVSARKYRPSSFETLVGQDNIARTLKNSIQTGQLAHAYLFCGPRGVGKTSTARIFAKTINCSNPTDQMEPCGECESCRSFAEGRSYCIHELDAASNNSVDDIRSLTDQVRIPPQVGRYSVYIIDEVHMLSQAAFNAFLKTLEEPPAHAIFILATTEKHKILPTILSRCQTYDFNRITIADMVRNLSGIAQKESIRISEDALHIIAQKADGAMRDALTLFDQSVAFCGNDITYEQVIENLNVLDYEYYFRLTDMFFAADIPGSLMLLDEVLSRGFNALHFISGLSSHLRDLIVCKNDASRTLAELAPSIAARYDEYSRRCNMQFLFDALSATTACEAGYKNSGNPRLLIEFTLIKLCMMNGAAAKDKPVQQATPQVVVPQPVAASAPAPATVPARASATSATVPDATPASASAVPADPAPAVPSSAASTSAVSSAASTPAASVLASAASASATPARAASVPSSAAQPVGAFSIKNMLKQESADAADSGMVADAAPKGNPVTEQSLARAWEALLATVTKPNLNIALKRYQPVYNPENDTVTQFLSNAAQRDWIMEKCHLSLERTLRRELGNTSVKLAFDVKEAESGKEIASKPYMPAEKAAAMRKAHPGLTELETAFELEVK